MVNRKHRRGTGSSNSSTNMVDSDVKTFYQMREGRGNHINLNIKRNCSNIMLNFLILMMIRIKMYMKNGKGKWTKLSILVILKIRNFWNL